MNKDRIDRLRNKMRAEEVDQMLISDPVAIFYFLGRWFEPGERLIVLYVHKDGDIVLLNNELFPLVENLGIEIKWYRDDMDCIEILSKIVKEDKSLGIDKAWPSGFLIRLQAFLQDKKYINSSLLVDEVRKIKDEKERNFMRKSSLINDEVMEDFIPYVKEDMTEIQLSDKLKEIYRKHGIRNVSFEPVVAFGKNAADPHHSCDDTKGKRGDCVVLDIGGMYENYASDMTRTVFLGEVSDRHREIYEIVKEANRRGREMALPGNKMKDVDKAARDYIEEKGFGKYFTHRTGHSIGLETHESGDVSLANDSIIEVGQCFSVEPGIYIMEENIGVRIEDIVLVTENGPETLNKVSRDLRIVEL